MDNNYDKDTKLAEHIALTQYILILLLRTKKESNGREYREITNKELHDLINPLMTPMRDLPEDIQGLVTIIRKNRYNIE